MIYLFSNENFGENFIDTAANFSKTLNAEIVVVHSEKRKFKNSLLGKLNHCIGFIKKKLKESRFKNSTGLHLMILSDINGPDFIQKINKDDHGIVAGFNQIFKPKTIAKFKSLVNFHPSILPLYRGPVPSYWCIKYKETTTGFTLHRVTEKIDAGEILYQGKVSIGSIPNEDELDKEISRQTQPVFLKYLEHIIKGDGQWDKTLLNSFDIYKNQKTYLSFPE